MRVQVEDGGDDGSDHDADEDGGDDLGESGQHQQDGQHPQADHERHPDRAVEPEHEGLELGTEALGVRREPEELGQLAHDDEEGETVHVADLHLTREQVGDEAEASYPQPDLDESDDDGEHPGQRDGTMHVATRQQWHKSSKDHSTGYGRVTLPFSKEHIRSEILCHGLGAHMMYPDTRTVLDIGGQDTKAIQVDASGIVENFQMNDRCAAGCGRYLGYIADEMNMGLHELGPMAMKATRTVRINSTCTVFAGAELRDRLALGEKREDILAGLHRAIILRAMSIISRSGGVRDQFTFTGGVAKNEAAVKELRQLIKENYGDRVININSESIYTGALGAAAFARRAVEN